MYSLLINLLSRPPISVPFRICIDSVHFARSDAFCRSMKHTHSSSSVSKVRPGVILSIRVAPAVHFPFLNPNQSPSTSSSFLSVLLNILAAISADGGMVTVAVGFFCKTFIESPVTSRGRCPVYCTLLISCVTLTPVAVRRHLL